MYVLILDGVYIFVSFGVLEIYDLKVIGELKCFKYVRCERKVFKINLVIGDVIMKIFKFCKRVVVFLIMLFCRNFDRLYVII